MLQPLLGMAGSSIRLQQLDLLADWDWIRSAINMDELSYAGYAYGELMIRWLGMHFCSVN